MEFENGFETGTASDTEGDVEIPPRSRFEAVPAPSDAEGEPEIRPSIFERLEESDQEGEPEIPPSDE